MSDAERRVEAYLRGATRGLWGRERATVREELEAHIRTRTAAHCLAGASEAEALERALAELGHPGQVNAGMSRLYVPPLTLLALRQALRQFRGRPLESALIVVAVALGVAVVTAVAALLDLDRQARARYDALLAAREITVQSVESDPHAFSLPSGVTASAKRLGAVNEPPVRFSPGDLQDALVAAPSVEYAYIAEARSYFKREWVAENPEFPNPIYGLSVTPDYMRAARVEVVSGSLFAPSDFEQGGVMLISAEGAMRLGLPDDPVGATVTFDATPSQPSFTVIGVLPAPIAPPAGDWAYHLLTPFAPAPFTTLDKLTFAVGSARDLPAARAELADLARAVWDERVSVSVQPGREHGPPPLRWLSRTLRAVSCRQ